ncbi:SET domain-containing protein [Lentinus tigrinus ALCF2SS1-7]|uniref:SET domain-containing protein n=1 Tax=Lentinus tigrinus ALCF2SS1-6 TaxID=1328759 RepID=A0A5C2S6M6_9APHY|nr:SET domain-containing protein [Lentinus tigrinus ALCF2SS1-6]RPD69843.1 SET domain-containing protein [Lentinus tigrinus ALCF2SS1-7]
MHSGGVPQSTPCSAPSSSSTLPGSSLSPKSPADSQLTSKVIPIPARYQEPQPSPDFKIDVALLRSLTLTQVPVAESSPELLTGFMHCTGMLDALRAQYPGWPQPFPPPPRVYKIVPVEGAGLGVIATADIAVGETIVRERPILVTPQVFPLVTSDGGSVLDMTVDALHPANKRAFFALHNCKGKAAPSEVKAIMDTNGFPASCKFPVWGSTYMAVTRDASRINHSCCNNAVYSFDIATLTAFMRASRPIRAGEEITISYLNFPAQTAEGRQEELGRRYGFKCRCKTCRLTGAARLRSDMARLAILESALPSHIRADDAEFAMWLVRGAQLQLPAAAINPKTNAHPLGLAESVWAAMLQEGCYVFSTGLCESVLLRLVKACSVLQNEEAVRFYATQAALIRMAHTGSDGGWRAVAENPRRTDWWAKFTAKRKGVSRG